MRNCIGIIMALIILGIVGQLDAATSNPVPSPVLDVPGEVGMGQPFLVRLTSDLELEEVSIQWMGKKSLLLSLFGTIAMWQLPFHRPVSRKITSSYGLRRFLNKKPKNPHRGLDFRAASGSAVEEVAQGRVLLVEGHFPLG